MSRVRCRVAHEVQRYPDSGYEQLASDTPAKDRFAAAWHVSRCARYRSPLGIIINKWIELWIREAKKSSCRGTEDLAQERLSVLRSVVSLLRRVSCTNFDHRQRSITQDDHSVEEEDERLEGQTGRRQYVRSRCPRRAERAQPRVHRATKQPVSGE